MSEITVGIFDTTPARGEKNNIKPIISIFVLKIDIVINLNDEINTLTIK